MTFSDCLTIVRRLQCWTRTRRVIREHQRWFHAAYATSHCTYMVLVWWEGHTLYAMAAGPAALAYIIMLALTSGEE